MNTNIASKLDAWGIVALDIQPLMMRENAIYKIISKSGKFALKVTRIGYRSIAELHSEMELLEYLSSNHFAVTEPVLTMDGRFVEEYDDGLVAITRWIDATPFEEVMCEQRFFELGALIARFHQLSTQWQLPVSFSRPLWDQQGLLGNEPHWGRFWENPILSKDEKQHFLAFCVYARNHFPDNPHQIIHADLVKENVLVTDQQLIFIDFDDMGTGDTHLDLATALLKHDSHPEYKQWRAALIQGYCQYGTINADHLELFLAIRAATYLGWIIGHPMLDSDGQRSKRYCDQALQYSQQFV